jgi:hypothetical protein
VTAFVMDGVTLTQTVAAELLALSPGEPTAMSDDDALSAMHLILVAHHCNVVECSDDLWQRYVEDPGFTSARMSRCVIVAARLIGVEA